MDETLSHTPRPDDELLSDLAVEGFFRLGDAGEGPYTAPLPPTPDAARSVEVNTDGN